MAEEKKKAEEEKKMDDLADEVMPSDEEDKESSDSNEECPPQNPFVPTTGRRDPKIDEAHRKKQAECKEKRKEKRDKVKHCKKIKDKEEKENCIKLAMNPKLACLLKVGPLKEKCEKDIDAKERKRLLAKCDKKEKEEEKE